MSRAAIILTVLLSFGCLGLFCPGPTPGPPDPDSCSSPQVGALTELELGRPNEDSFEPLAEDAVHDLVIGGQGSSMMAFRLRLRGTVPACLDQQTHLVHNGNPLGQNLSPLRTYQELDGSRTTKTLYVVLSGSDPPYGDSVQVTTTVGTRSLVRTLWIGTMFDAAVPDSARPDTSIPDATAADARD